MVTLDLASLSNDEVEEAVTFHCTKFGTVSGVKVLPPAKDRNYALAVVSMCSDEETNKVMVKVGDMKFGANAIIRLVQE